MSTGEVQTAHPFKTDDIVECKEQDTDYGGTKYPVGTLEIVEGVGRGLHGPQTFYVRKLFGNPGGLQASRWSLWPPANTTLPPTPTPTTSDPVTHPAHYTAHPSGIECITITEHMGFCLGNAIKYIWRADLKADSIQDLRKAVWYLEREIAKREKSKI